MCINVEFTNREWEKPVVAGPGAQSKGQVFPLDLICLCGAHLLICLLIHLFGWEERIKRVGRQREVENKIEQVPYD